MTQIVVTYCIIRSMIATARHKLYTSITVLKLFNHTNQHTFATKTMGLVKCQQLDGAYLQSYNAKVISCNPITNNKQHTNGKSNNKQQHHNNNNNNNVGNISKQLYECVLDDTILFPSGGGQNTDYGYINDIHCNNVLRSSDSSINAIHIIEQSIEPNTDVRVTVDWHRRYDHMIQHTSQHLISAVALNKYNMKTVSWHMSNIHEPCYIVFQPQSNNIIDDNITDIENTVNQHIRNHTPVNLYIFNSYDEAKKLEHLRLGAQFDEDHSGQLRVIEIENVDTNACCGTHIKNCSEIQSIVFSKIERNKGQIKIYFYAGQRVNTQLHNAFDIYVQLNSVLKISPDKFGDATNKLQNDIKAANKRINKIQSQLIQYNINELYSTYINDIDNNKILTQHYADSSLSYIQELADTLQSMIQQQHNDSILPVIMLTCSDSDNDNDNNGSIILYYDTTTEYKKQGELIENWFKLVLSDNILAGKGGGKPGKKQGKITRLDKLNQAIQQLKALTL